MKSRRGFLKALGLGVFVVPALLVAEDQPKVRGRRKNPRLKRKPVDLSSIPSSKIKRYTYYDITHSMTLQLESGEIVEIPEPGKGWKCVSTTGNYRPTNDSIRDIKLRRADNFLNGCDFTTYCGDRLRITHRPGISMFAKYQDHLLSEKVELISYKEFHRERREEAPWFIYENGKVRELDV